MIIIKQKLESSKQKLSSININSLEAAEQARISFESLQGSINKFCLLNDQVTKIININVREKLLKSTNESTSTDNVQQPKTINMKHEIMKTHKEREANLKIKTTGTPDENKIEEKHITESPETNEKVSNILSFNGIAENLFNEEDVKGYPIDLVSITYDKLMILNSCKNIFELAQKLAKGADLKELTGNSSGTWQFRINDTYRIRFETCGDSKGFINVRIGDYH